MQNEIPYPRDSEIQHAQDSGSGFLHLPRSFYICQAAFAFAVRLLHLLHGFCICRAAFTFATQLLQLLRSFTIFRTDF